MDEEFGASYISIEDEDGNQCELEHLDTFLFEKEEYMVFLPADMDEDDPDFGLIILKVVEQDGEELFAEVEEKDIQRVYDYYMENIFDGEDEIPED